MASSNATWISIGWILVMLAAGAAPLRADDATDFDRVVKPLLVRHCVACHGPEKPKGDVRLDGPAPDLVNAEVRATWENVYSWWSQFR